MITKISAGLDPWSRDLDASTDVRLNEREGFAEFIYLSLYDKGLRWGRLALRQGGLGLLGGWCALRGGLQSIPERVSGTPADL